MLLVGEAVDWTLGIPHPVLRSVTGPTPRSYQYLCWNLGKYWGWEVKEGGHPFGLEF